MKKQIVTVEPTFSERIWGGTRIRSQFNGVTDIDPVGEIVVCRCFEKER